MKILKEDKHRLVCWGDCLSVLRKLLNLPLTPSQFQLQLLSNNADLRNLLMGSTNAIEAKGLESKAWLINEMADHLNHKTQAQSS